MPCQEITTFNGTDRHMFNNQHIATSVFDLINQSEGLSRQIVTACDQTQQGDTLYVDVVRQIDNISRGLQMARNVQERPNQVFIENMIPQMIAIQHELLNFFKVVREKETRQGARRTKTDINNDEDLLNDIFGRLAHVVNTIHLGSCPYTTGRTGTHTHTHPHTHSRGQHGGQQSSSSSSSSPSILNEGWNGTEMNALRWVGSQTKENPSVLIGNAGYEAQEIPYLQPTKAVIENCDFGKGLMLQVGHTKSTDFFNRR